MNEKIVVPALGESVTEATIAKWLKNVGDIVVVDEVHTTLSSEYRNFYENIDNINNIDFINNESNIDALFFTEDKILNVKIKK